MSQTNFTQSEMGWKRTETNAYYWLISGEE